LEYYKYAITSREIFDLENKKDPATLTDIQRVTLKYSIGKSAASRMEGEGYCICRECWGTGIEHWCPKCGHNLNAPVK